jgi:aspartate/methionine/tyrosine aminotransferase
VLGKLTRGEKMISQRARKIKSFLVMDVLEKAQEMERQGANVIHLEIGEPDFETPRVIEEAAAQALEAGKTRYTHSLGLWELRVAIADHYKKTYGTEILPEQVVVTEGTSPALLLIAGVLLDHGDEVILSNPGYAGYPHFIRFMEGVPRFVEIYEEDGFQYKPEKIREKISPRTKAIFINSPSNPTGNLLDFEVMKKIAEIGRLVISDEIYHGLVYEGRAHSILELTNNAFVLNGFSKLYAMTGWRLGYVIAPPEFVRPIQKLQQNFFISANSFVQSAGVVALTRAQEDVRKMVETYNERRKYIIPRLRELGFGITAEPVGAFYVFANARHLGKDSYKLSLEILEKAKVAVAPGIDFGSNGEGYLRFSYANSLENIKEGMKRLEGYLSR